MSTQLAKVSLVLAVTATCLCSTAYAGIDETFKRPGQSIWSTDAIIKLLGNNAFTKSYAVVIGIGDYANLPKLTAPAADAEKIRDFLRDEASFDYIVTLTDEKASRTRIEDLMDRIIPGLLGTNDRFLFYFSGHGITRKLALTKRGYLALAAAKPDDWSQLIDMPRIRQWTENVALARHSLFLLDACFSGLSAWEPKSTPSEKTIERLMQPGHHIVTAGVEGEESYIYKGESLFTRAFLSAARGEGNSTADRIVSLGEMMTRINRDLDAKRVELGETVKMTPRQYYSRIENNAGEFFFVSTKPQLVGLTSTRDQPSTNSPLSSKSDTQPEPTLSVLPRKNTSDNLVLPVAEISDETRASLNAALQFVQQNKMTEATDLARKNKSKIAAALVEWAILINDDETDQITFERYDAFLNANPSWPGGAEIRRRAETILWDKKKSTSIINIFFAAYKPVTAVGKFALARSLLSQGDRIGAQELVVDAWECNDFTPDVENQALKEFGGLISPLVEKTRMDCMLYKGLAGFARPVAKRLGGNELAIANARMAVSSKRPDAQTFLDVVPVSSRRDAGYVFSQIQLLRRTDRFVEAAKMILEAPLDLTTATGADEWWIERRLLARKFLDMGDSDTAYRLVRDAVPIRDANRAAQRFTAGWIALRFLHDRTAALKHFSDLARATTGPASSARSSYWLGRTAEDSNDHTGAENHYRAASQFRTAYYGQLSSSHIAMDGLQLEERPEVSSDEGRSVYNSSLAQAVELLYAANARTLAFKFVTGIVDKMTPKELVVFAEIAKRHNHARLVARIGKSGIARGIPLYEYGYPTIGVPRFHPIGPDAPPSLIYSIVAQETAFDYDSVSSSDSKGLMQVTPTVAQYIAKKYAVPYDENRLVEDIVYNVQLGAAELGSLIEDYHGSLVLAIAAYNAGSSSVNKWIELYGDPRDKAVDPVDWIERIPFSETRNYVQRVMEALQIYRIRVEGDTRSSIDADLARGIVPN
jgi:soluble lytic murein transglycosylase